MRTPTLLFVATLVLGTLAAMPVASADGPCPPDEQTGGCQPNPVRDLVCSVLQHTRIVRCVEPLGP